MTTPTEKLAALEAQAKAARKLAERLASPSAPTAHNATKDAEKRLADKVQLDRHMHEIHCLAVELGLADPQSHRYGEKIVALGFGRETRDPRRTPTKEAA